MAAVEANIKEYPIEYQNFKDIEEETAALLADNKIAEFAEIDTDILKELIENLDIDNFDIASTGYSQDEINELMTAFEDAGVLDEDNIEIEEDYKPFTKYGDIWLLGKHKLICGDSTKLNDLSKLMQDEKADLLITDPPYNVNYEGGTGLKIQNDNMADDVFRLFLKDAFLTCDEVMKEGAAFYIWHADSEGYNFRLACNQVDWKVRQCLIWVKNSIVLGRQDYQWKHEPCLYGWKSGAGHYFIDERNHTTVLEYDKPLKSDIHPTMKPVELFEYLINNSSCFGEIVLDAFGGSGTTIVACERLGRIARVVELDEKYCDAIVKRFINLYSNDNVRCIRDGKEINYTFDDLTT